MRVSSFEVKSRRYPDHVVRVYAERYGSPYEVYTVAKTRPCKSDYTDFLVSCDPSSPRFNGFRTKEELLDRIQHGVQDSDEEIGKVIAYAAKAIARDEEKLVQEYWDVSGVEVDVASFLSGIPECMRNYEMAPVKSNILGVVIFVEACSDIDIGEFRTVGMIVLKVIAKAEKAGYAVRLVAADMYNRGGRSVYTITVNVKAEDEPLNYRKAMFPLTDIAFVRGLGFGWYSRMPYGSENLGGYAMCAFPYDERTEMMDEVFQRANPDLQSMVTFSMRNLVDILRRDGKERVEKVIESKIMSV